VVLSFAENKDELMEMITIGAEKIMKLPIGGKLHINNS
jgi:hypothetical protein